MSNLVEERLVRELELRARDVQPIAGLAARLVERGQARRRHRRTALASVAATAFVVVLSVATFGLPGRPSVTSAHQPRSVDLAQDLASGRGLFAVNPPQGAVPIAKVHLDGHVIAAPEGLRIDTVRPAGAGAVVRGLDGMFAAAYYVDPDGSVRALTDINSPGLVTSNGRQVVGTYESQPSRGEGSVAVDDLATGQVVQRAPFDPDYPPHQVDAVLANGDVVVSGDPAGVQVWHRTSDTVTVIPGTAKRWGVAAVAPSGTLLLSDGHGNLRLVDRSGKTLKPPVLRLHGGQGQIDVRSFRSAPVFSPDGSKLAFVAWNGALVIEDLADRSQLVQPAPSPPAVPGGSLLREPLITLSWTNNDVVEAAVSQDSQVTVALCPGTVSPCAASRSIDLQVRGSVVLPS